MASWTTEESSAMDKCGHCDNCTRSVGTVLHKDVTLEAWQILKIVQAVDKEGGRQTISGLADLARGGGGGAFETGGKRKRVKDKVRLDYDAVAGGEVALSKDVRQPLTVFSFRVFGRAPSRLWTSLATFQSPSLHSPHFVYFSALRPMCIRADSDGTITWMFFSRISKLLLYIYSSRSTSKKPFRPPHTQSTSTSHRENSPSASRDSPAQT